MKSIGLYGDYNPLFMEALRLKRDELTVVPSTPNDFKVFPGMIHPKAILRAAWNTLVNPPQSKSEALIRYQAAYIREHKLKTVLTFVDNREPFYRLANFVPETKFYAIQNGVRLNLFEQIFDNCNYKTRAKYVCFGEIDKASILKTKVDFEEIFEVGSILADYAWETAEPSDEAEYDICLVSQWRPNIFNKPYSQAFDLIGFPWGYDLLLSHLSRLQKELGIKVVVAGASYNEVAEINYFNQRLQPGYEYVPRSRNLPSSYWTTKKSKITTGLNSSCIYEAFGHGKRVLICDYYEYEPHHFSGAVDPIWVLKRDETTYEIFKDKFLKVRDMAEADFQKNVLPVANKRVFYDAQKPAHRFMRELLGT